MDGCNSHTLETEFEYERLHSRIMDGWNSHTLETESELESLRQGDHGWMDGWMDGTPIS